jgi:hypothetical protein
MFVVISYSFCKSTFVKGGSKYKVD